MSAHHEHESRLAQQRKRKAVQPESAVPNAADELQRLQRVVGNQALQRMLASGGVIQTKMTVGPADDPYEQEADAVAQEIMTMPDPLQRNVEEENLEEEMLQGKLQREEMLEEEELQMKVQRSAAGDVPAVSDETEQQITTMKGSGQSMPDGAQQFFESRFGQDFGDVNIHTGAESDQLNRQLEARAFTTGSDIFFRDGEYNPDSSDGRELLAHELTHVVQQGGSKSTDDDGEGAS